MLVVSSKTETNSILLHQMSNISIYRNVIENMQP